VAARQQAVSPTPLNWSPSHYSQFFSPSQGICRLAAAYCMSDMSSAAVLAKKFSERPLPHQPRHHRLHFEKSSFTKNDRYNKRNHINTMIKCESELN